MAFDPWNNRGDERLDWLILNNHGMRVNSWSKLAADLLKSFR